MKKIFTFFIYIIFFSKSILCSIIDYCTDNESKKYLYKTPYTMEQVKNFEIVNCKKDEDCPEYSNGCYIPKGDKEGVCNVFFFCHGIENENCYILNESEYINKDCRTDNTKYKKIKNSSEMFHYRYYKIKNEIKNETQIDLILTSCEKNNIINYKCKSDFCFRNKDCYSKKCYLGNCQTNNEYKSYMCSLQSFFISDIDVNYTIGCKYSKQEECNYNAECFTNKCDTKSLICVEDIEENQFQEKEKNEILGIPTGVVVVLSIIFSILLCGYMCCRPKQPTRLRID